MKAIMIMFDTLSKNFLSTYGNEWIKTPNFDRLSKKTVIFDNYYAGSLPCMPARRELHTGRYNFLHRSWGPLEPFDFSAIEFLKNNGIYTHLVTDHCHYFEDGGATYHNRYNTWEGFRGQEGDRWKAIIGKFDIPKQNTNTKEGVSFRQNWINRKYMNVEKELSSYKTFEAGLHFLKNNYKDDNWFLQIECFDPHEPFYVLKEFADMYPHEYNGDYFDWPNYQPVTDDEKTINHLKMQYAALISMCDKYLGKILDFMDKNKMWNDTMLIVNTDHGFLIGEHNWYGKNVMPIFNEIAHLPFFIWDPRINKKGERRSELVQTIDIPATLLEYFGFNLPDSMKGIPLKETIENDKKIRDTGLFGVFGGHVNIVDRKYVYMRGPVSIENKPLYEYTLMPTKLRGFFSRNQLNNMKLVNNFNFLNNCPVIRTVAELESSSYIFGNRLYDLKNDKFQENPLDNVEIEVEMIEKLRLSMIDNEAPYEQYERLGIKKDEKLTVNELYEQKLIRKNDDFIEINEKYFVNENCMKQLKYLKSIIRDENERKNIGNYFENVMNKNNINILTEDIIIEEAEKIIEKYNLGDKKKVLLKLIKSSKNF